MENRGRESPYLRFVVPPIIILVLISAFVTACGRRGDPVAITPYKVGIDSKEVEPDPYGEVGVVNDLKASIMNDNIYLTWGMPEGKSFPEKALKGFIIFRAEVPDGAIAKEYENQYVSIDFVKPNKKKNFEHFDIKAAKDKTYAYKLVVKDKMNRTGKDSNIVLVKVPKPGEAGIIKPDAPTGLAAIYTRQSIVLTWDEIHGQEIKFYRIYRSEGEDFSVIAETVTSVFNDKNIEPSKKYYYKVSAVGNQESLLSEEIKIITKNR